MFTSAAVLPNLSLQPLFLPVFWTGSFGSGRPDHADVRLGSDGPFQARPRRVLCAVVRPLQEAGPRVREARHNLRGGRGRGHRQGDVIVYTRKANKQTSKQANKQTHNNGLACVCVYTIVTVSVPRDQKRRGGKTLFGEKINKIVVSPCTVFCILPLVFGGRPTVGVVKTIFFEVNS